MDTDNYIASRQPENQLEDKFSHRGASNSIRDDVSRSLSRVSARINDSGEGTIPTGSADNVDK